jgi:ferredoxin
MKLQKTTPIIVIMDKNVRRLFMVTQRRKSYAQVDKSKCVACGSCIKVCPRGAISVPKGIYAEVDLQKCIGCGLCAKICPASVITIMQHNTSQEGLDNEK